MPSSASTPTPDGPPAGYMKTLKDIVAGTCGEEKRRKGTEEDKCDNEKKKQTSHAKKGKKS